MDPLYLLDEELDYALRLRKVRSKKNISSNRAILKNILNKDKSNVRELIDPDFSPDSEKEKIDRAIIDLESLITGYAGSVDDSLVHV